MIDFWHTVVLGLLQGASELFAVSSLGHAMILPRLLGWESAPASKNFETHLLAGETERVQGCQDAGGLLPQLCRAWFISGRDQPSGRNDGQARFLHT